MRKSNYDKRPVLHVRTKGVSAWQGWMDARARFTLRMA